MKHKKPSKIDITAISKRYHVTPRTVRRWRNEGAPLGDAKRLSAWLALKRQAPIVTPPTKARPDRPKSKLKSLPTGAAYNLARLEQAEADAAAAMFDAVSSRDALAIAAARKHWLTVSEQLRRHNRDIAEDKRVTARLIPLESAQHMVASFAEWFCLSLSGSLMRTTPYLISAKSFGDVWEVLGADLRSGVSNALAACRAWPYKDKLPISELVDAAQAAVTVDGGIGNLDASVDAKTKLLTDFYKEFVGEIAVRNIGQRAPKNDDAGAQKSA